MEALANVLEEISKGRWQWQSNPNPWDKKERPQWESYSLEHNYLIEKAYYDKKDEIDVGDYRISIKHMIQMKKDSNVSQRPIKRINWEDDVQEIYRSERYFETELPKTINRIFGSLGDFISFFSKRNQGILDFTNDFKDFERSNDLEILNSIILPKVVDCFEEVLLKPNLEQQKNSPALSKIKKKILSDMNREITTLISLFKKEFQNTEEFYGHILMAYTMNTDLYPILNNSLRNENWTDVDKLLPYAFCLCKAFFNSRPQTNFAQDHKTPTSMLLYRGTAFDELSLSFYPREKGHCFSWNSVTSTSKDNKIAEEFMYKNTDLANKKYPVMFVIEVPVSDEFESEYLKWIDIHRYSAIPKEDEVVLPPGSVFELIEMSTDQDKRTILKIKLRNEIKSLAHGGMMMQGALQSQLMTEKEARIMCLGGEELHQALMSLKGNKLIEELEFCLCTFDKKRQEEMFEILLMLQKVKRLRFIACTSEANGEITDQGPMERERCEITKLEVIEASNFFQMICNQKQCQKYWIALRELDLHLRSRRSLGDEELDDEVSQGLKYFPQLVSLNISFQGRLDLADAELNSLAHSLNSLTQLAHLDIDFCFCENITDEGVNNLAKSLSFLTHLAHLNMNFQSCKKITDETANNLAQALNPLTQLTYLKINFYECKQITGNGVNTLVAQGLNSQLKSLDLCFDDDMKNTRLLSQKFRNLIQLKSLTLASLIHNNKELKSFVCDGLKHLLQLKSLTLLFWSKEDKEEITDRELKVFASKGLKPLLSLTSLNLRFSGFDQITDKGVKSLASQGLKYLIRLKSLTLEFENCDQITEKGASSMMSQGLKNLTNLTSLVLGFEGRSQVTEKGIVTLASKWLRDLPIFESLVFWHQKIMTFDDLTQQQQKYWRNSPRVKLARAREISQRYKQSLDEGFSGLLSEKSNLKMVSNLSKAFKESEKIASKSLLDKLIPILKRNEDRTHNPHSALKALEIFPKIRYLASLNFNFEKNWEVMTDEIVHKIASQVLRHCSQLRFLTLNFGCCSQITDEGVNDLALYGLKSLTVLVSLTLNFGLYSSPKLTDKGVFVIAWEGLRHLPQLHSLHLNFSACEKITDKGVNDLALYGLKSLENLVSLNLNFSGYEKITDKGVLDLVSKGLRHLSQLKYLDLKFFCCDKITDDGWRNLAWNGLKYLPQLESLALKSCMKITNKGVENFVFQGLKYLAQLKSLSLDFSGSEITDEGVRDLSLHGLKPLVNLASLNLGFSFCEKITDQGMMNLACEGLRHLSKLKSLTLDFRSCEKLTNEGWMNLAWNGLKFLSQVESLSLEPCQKITDKGVDSLVSQGFKYLTKLKSLMIDFCGCDITDKGVNNLILRVVKDLPQLASLDFNFGDARYTSDFTTQNIIKVLHYFGFTEEIDEV